MKVEKTHVIQAHYRLKEDNAEGKIIEQTYDKEPLDFVFGVGMMIPAFEIEIEGMQAGENKSFPVVAEEAYGLYNDDNVIDLPIQNFGTEEERKENLIIGKNIHLQDNAGNEHVGLVQEITDEFVKIDFNHPLAGNDLFFEVEILSIRASTPEELDEMGLVYES